MTVASETDNSSHQIISPSSLRAAVSPTTPIQHSPQSNRPRRPRPLIVRALYDYTSNRPNVLSFRKGTLIRVITELRSGWWDGRIEMDNTRGWFPRSMVTKVEDEGYDNEDGDAHPTIFRARYNFQSWKPNVLSFEKGAIIRVVTKSGSGWWEGNIEGEDKLGWFPRKFVVSEAEYETERKRLSCLPATLRAVEDYESQHSRCPSFKKGDLIGNARKLKWGYWEGVLEGHEAPAERTFFRDKYVERVDEDEEQIYAEEIDQDPEDIDWLLRMSRHGIRETYAADAMTELDSQIQENVEQIGLEERMTDLDVHDESRKESSLEIPFDDEWDFCEVSDHEYSLGPKVAPEAKRSNTGAVDADFEEKSSWYEGKIVVLRVLRKEYLHICI